MENNQIDFLDLKIIKKESKFLTKWIRKPCKLNLITKWNSFKPKEQKLNALHNIIYRSYNVTSSEFYENTKKNVVKLFQNAGYPNNIIRQEFFKIENPRLKSFGPKKCPVYFGIQYNGEQSESFKKSLTKLIKPFLPPFKKLVIFFKASKPITSHFSNNYKTNDTRQCVYDIKCQTCNFHYIGETGSHLKTRMKQHKESKKYNNPSACASHELNNHGHIMDYENPKPLYFEKDKIRRKVIEALFIRNSSNLLNENEKSFKLNIWK
jgi:hypothetical protein